MQTFNTDPQKIRDTQQLIENEYEEFSRDFTALKSEFEGLFGANWRGIAQKGYQPGWEEWLDGGHKVQQGLETTAALLAKTAQAHSQQEQDNQQSFKGAS